MSESLVHQRLVSVLLAEMKANVVTPSPFVYADCYGSSLPPLIGNARPDVYAHFIQKNRVIVGEAKTDSDIQSMRTLQQLEMYFEYLNGIETGELWVAVPWLSAGAAMRICKAIKTRANSSVAFHVSGWMLGETPLSRTWHG
jgi:hypothetical protein